jgi:hypothetical protein
MTDERILLYNVWWALARKIVGRKLSEGPWQRLGPDRFSIPTVPYMSSVIHPCPLLAPHRDLVIKIKKDGVDVEREKDKSGNHEIDPVWRRG